MFHHELSLHQSVGTSGMLFQQPKGRASENYSFLSMLHSYVLILSSYFNIVVFPGSSVNPLSGGLATQSLPPRLGSDASPNSGGMLGMTHSCKRIMYHRYIKHQTAFIS